MSTISRGYRLYKREGLKGVYRRLSHANEELPVTKINPYEQFAHFLKGAEKSFDSQAYNEHKYDDKKLINWIIPGPFEGSGGHINIFRFASMLENDGFHCRIYCLGADFENDEQAQEFCEQNFIVFDKSMEVFKDLGSMSFAHASIATQWTTAYALRDFNNTVQKYYFVQDFEPYFYPLGTEYAFAELPYHFGFKAITAGDWLKDVMSDTYGLDATSFRFSYDKQAYFPHERRDNVRRIFFYARPTTPRRNFELGILVLTELCKKMPDIEVVFAGGDLSAYEIPIPNYRCLGVMSPAELAEVYSQCDICLVFSYTNLSLLPIEIMASGSVVASSEGPNNEWILNESNSILVNNDPDQIIEKLEYFLTHEEERCALRDAGLEFARSTDWVEEGAKVRDAVLRGIEEAEKEMQLKAHEGGDS
jgi:glycosyltransferase involved in cell wall biosynthesis